MGISNAYRDVIRIKGMSQSQSIGQHGIGHQRSRKEVSLPHNIAKCIILRRHTDGNAIHLLAPGLKSIMFGRDDQRWKMHTSTIAAATHTITLSNAMNRMMAIAGKGTFLIPGNRRCDRSACLTSDLIFHLLPAAWFWVLPSDTWSASGVGEVESRMVEE